MPRYVLQNLIDNKGAELSRIETIGNATLYLGDCREILPMFPLCSVDAIVTSPPYNNWRNRRTQKRKADYWARTNIVYDTHNDALPDDEYAAWQTEIIDLCLDAIKKTGTIAYNHKDRIFNFKATSPLSWITKSHGIVRQRVTWNRCGMQAFNDCRFYRTEEDIYIIGHDVGAAFKWNKEFAALLSVWDVVPDKRAKHPAPMAVEIARRCVAAFTTENDLVADPFMGSGTTALAALALGRRFVGIEISEAYFDIACRRIEDAQRQSRMFE